MMTPHISRTGLSYLSHRAAALALGAAFLAACSDEPTAPNATPAAGVAGAAAAPTESAAQQLEDARADELARALARALADPSLRGGVRHAMRAAPNREHKLDFRGFLTSPAGARLAKAVGEQLGKPGAELTQFLNALPALEVYLPVRSHRAAWRGGSELIVAAGLHEREAPRGFALDGTPVALDATAAPKQPALVLTKAETDFSKALDAAEWENVEDAGGAAVGTMVRRADAARGPAPRSPTSSASASAAMPSLMLDPCDPTAIYCEEPPPPPPPPSYPVRPPGVWLDNMHVNDYAEPWYRGTAEITLVLTTPGMNGFPGTTISCSGQYATTQAQNDAGMKYFDQSGHDWSRQPHLLEGLLFGQADLTQFGQIYNSNIGVGIDVWEDDTGGANCQFSGGALNNTEAFINDLRRAYGFVSQVITIVQTGGNPIAIGVSIVQAIRGLVGTGDDLLLGHAINVRLADGSASQTQYRLVRERFLWWYGMNIYQGIQDNGHITVTIIQPPVT